MELPNTHFEDFPIEFKEINPEDFKLNNSLTSINNGFKVRRKIIIEPDETGYIYTNLIPHIKIERKDTLVINAPVGYGKSYAIIKTIEKIYNNVPNSLIIVATPFVSLVEQYVNDIKKDTEINLEQIYDYTDLGRRPHIPYLNKRIQVITVNTLLGNSGEDGFKNSDKKRKYINELIYHCSSNNIKVYFIYDEIHDAIQNFKEEFIFNLWKWKDVIQKNFIISATFNEASKIVIEYLAELTDKKIQIVESIRKRFPEKQSTLHLHYSSEYNFNSTTNELVELVDRLLSKNKNIDILSYSKTLAKSIIKDKIGKKLKDKFGDLNDCTSELKSNQRPKNEPPKNRYNNEMCNIGTNFKSGVSIKKNNHAFIIILPPRNTRLWFKNRYGIFAGGINSIIQALARQRGKGEIHIILPRPDKFDYNSLRYAGFTENQMNIFKQRYDLVNHYKIEINKLVKYIPLSLQDLLLKNFYEEELKGNVENEINFVGNIDRNRLARLLFPTYDLFKLNRGEDFLANTYKFYGEDISAYLTYCAFTNQFINCKLVEINYKTTLFFEEGKLQETLNFYFDKYFGMDYYDSHTTFSNFHMFYKNIRNRLFEEFELKFKSLNSTSWKEINTFNNKTFENQLLRFCGLLFYQRNYFYIQDYEERMIDNEYNRSNYFLDCMAVSNTINLEESGYNENYNKKIKAYKNFNYFREKMLQNIGHSNRHEGFDYLPTKPFQNFVSENELQMFNETISFLIENDDLIKNDIFNFRRNFINKTQKAKIESLYKIFIEDFFETLNLTDDRRVTINGKLIRVKSIISTKTLSNPKKIIDLITPANYDSDFTENYLKELEDFENYQEKISDLISKTI